MSPRNALHILTLDKISKSSVLQILMQLEFNNVFPKQNIKHKVETILNS
jgi:hypothetical protein